MHFFFFKIKNKVGVFKAYQGLIDLNDFSWRLRKYIYIDKIIYWRVFLEFVFIK